MKHTKIVATVGPASDTLEIMEQLILAGVDVFRLNFSHGTHEYHKTNAENIRKAANKLGTAIAIMCDLQGPKIRVSKFKNGKIELINGASFMLDTSFKDLGDETIVGVDYKNLHNDVKKNDVLLLDDGKVALTVTKVSYTKIHCVVLQGGILSNNKGINKRGGGLTAPALTAKDLDDIKISAEIEADYVAVSFPKGGADMYMARELLRTSGSKALLIAKVERAEAVHAMEEILDASDGVMVARGDLAVEVGDAQVPAIQKKLIKLARNKNKLTITATQMMESMITSPVPTRAEVSDVANAVLDGTDAVMLSAETAAGKFPVESVAAMTRTCIEADRTKEIGFEIEFLGRKFDRIDQTVAMATLFSAHHMQVKAIVALTESGATPLWMSRLNCGIPIYALTNSSTSRNRMALYREVIPMVLKDSSQNKDKLLKAAEKFLLDKKIVVKGDLIVITVGDSIGQIGGTNTMKILQIGS